MNITFSKAGWPYWIWISSEGTESLRLWEAKMLRLQLDEAIEYIERQEELGHKRRLVEEETE